MATGAREHQATPASRRAHLPATVWVLGFVSLMMDVSSEMIHSLLPVFLVTAMGASALTVGLIEGVAEATALILKVFSGSFSDYLGRRKPLLLFGYGLSALAKPLFALATAAGPVLLARLIDRVGKGTRGAPRDALLADITPPSLRGAAYGLRQSLDTVGALLGPLLAIALMLLWHNNFRAIFWVALIPAAVAVMLLLFAVHEPPSPPASQQRRNPFSRPNLRQLTTTYWWVVVIGALFALARFSEAFLVLRAEQGGLALSLVPLVLVAMNLTYALGAYPFGRLSDRLSHFSLLALGLLVLIAADLAMAYRNQGLWLWGGITLWGLHMGITQGLLARMVADSAPLQLRGTAFGFFNLVSGMATLLASLIAGLLWERFGASQTFTAGALLSLLALLVIGVRGRSPPPGR